MLEKCVYCLKSVHIKVDIFYRLKINWIIFEIFFSCSLYVEKNWREGTFAPCHQAKFCKTEPGCWRIFSGNTTEEEPSQDIIKLPWAIYSQKRSEKAQDTDCKVKYDTPSELVLNRPWIQKTFQPKLYQCTNNFNLNQLTLFYMAPDSWVSYMILNSRL